jgi:hypothetical protein
MRASSSKMDSHTDLKIITHIYSFDNEKKIEVLQNETNNLTSSTHNKLAHVSVLAQLVESLAASACQPTQETLM